MLNLLPETYLKKFFLEYLNTSSVRDLHEFLFLIERKLGIGSGSSVSESGEEVVLEILDEMVSNEKIIFDVGANVGQYANGVIKYFAQQNNFHLHCFEPSQKTFQSLSENIVKNNSASLNCFALGKQEQAATLFMNKQGSGLASLTKRDLDHIGIDHGALSETVQISTLDRYCETHSISHIHLLKIDVEGHELDVLKGAANMLAANHIELIQFEFGGCNIDTRTYFRDFHGFFSQLNYELFRILPDHKLLKLPKYREIDEKFRTSNYLAAPKALKLNIQFRKHCV